MNRTVTIAPVRKSIRVNANQAHAFEVFTSGLGRWWPRTHTIGMQAAVLEPRLGGRWYELSEDGSQADVGTAGALRDQLGPQQQLEAGHHGELRGRSQVHRAGAASDPGGARASQFRAAGRGSGRLHAQGRRRRLARHAGTLQAGGRGIEPTDAGRPRRITLNSTSQGIRIPHHKENVMAIELYVFPPSPRAFKVMAVANHLGLGYEIRFVDF